MGESRSHASCLSLFQYLESEGGRLLPDSLVTLPLPLRRPYNHNDSYALYNFDYKMNMPASALFTPSPENRLQVVLKVDNTIEGTFHRIEYAFSCKFYNHSLILCDFFLEGHHLVRPSWEVPNHKRSLKVISNHSCIATISNTDKRYLWRMPTKTKREKEILSFGFPLNKRNLKITQILWPWFNQAQTTEVLLSFTFQQPMISGHYLKPAKAVHMQERKLKVIQIWNLGKRCSQADPKRFVYKNGNPTCKNTRTWYPGFPFSWEWLWI